MLHTRARRGVVGGTALVVGLAGLTIGQGAAHAGTPLPAELAGPVAVWGPGMDVDPETPGYEYLPPQPTPAQASQAFTKVLASGAVSGIGLTADGRVEEFGENPFGVEIPTATLAGKTVVDIAGDGTYGGGMAVTSTGEVIPWSAGFEPWAGAMPSASELQGSVAATINATGDMAAVVKQDGSVRVWGSSPAGAFGQTNPPTLTNATAVFIDSGATTVYALKSDGTVTAWGNDTSGQTDYPDVTIDTTDDVHVVDIATSAGSAVALLSDGTLSAWGAQTKAGAPGETTWVNEPPASTDDVEIVAVASNSLTYFAVDSTGTVHTWGQGAAGLPDEFETLPSGVDVANITGLSANDNYAMAIEAKFSVLARPTIAGTAKVDQTLTATPATFTSAPDEEPSGQWYRGAGEVAEEIVGATATTYKVSVDDLGEVLTYRSTATRGEQTVTAVSNPTAAVQAADPIGGGDDTAQQQKIAQAQQAYAAATAAAASARAALATASAPKLVKKYIKALTKVTRAQNKVKAVKAKVAQAKAKAKTAKGKAAKKKAKKQLTKAKKQLKNTNKALKKAKKALKKPQKKAGAAGKRYRAALAAHNAAVAAQAAAAQALASAQAGR